MTMKTEYQMIKKRVKNELKNRGIIDKKSLKSLLKLALMIIIYH